MFEIDWNGIIISVISGLTALEINIRYNVDNEMIK